MLQGGKWKFGRLTSNYTAITEIRANVGDEGVIDQEEIPSLKPPQLLQFITALRLDGELYVQENGSFLQLTTEIDFDKHISATLTEILVWLYIFGLNLKYILFNANSPVQFLQLYENKHITHFLILSPAPKFF